MLIILSKPGQTSKADRSAIYSHVATYSHRRRQRRQESQLQNEQNSPGHKLVSRSQVAKSQKWLPSLRDPTQGLDGPRCTVHKPKWIRDCSNCQRAVQALKISTSGPLVAYHGNSDPFDAQSVQIDAEANYYLDIGFRAFERVVWMSGFRAWCGPRGWVVPRTSSVSGLDSGINLCGPQLSLIPRRFKDLWSSAYANAVLAYHASAVLAVTGNAKHAAVVSKYLFQARKRLERYMTAEDMDSLCQPEELLYRLMRSEMLAQRFTDAMRHALDLRTMLLARADLSRLNLSFLLLFVYQTNNLAIVTWTRPILEAQWIEQMYGADWTALKEDGTSLSISRHSFESFANNAELVCLLIATQTLFVHTTACLAHQSAAPADRWYWLDARAHWLHIRLFNLVHDHKADSVTASACMNTCLALTALLSIRYQKFEPMLYRVALTPMSRILITKLWTGFSRLRALINTSEHILYGDVILWVTFVAALVEDRLQATMPRPRQPDLWPWWRSFVEALAFQRLCSWEDIRQCLYRFPYSEDETPLPSLSWLHEAVDSARHFSRLDENASRPEEPKHGEQQMQKSKYP